MQEGKMIDNFNPETEPMIGQDIPPLPCIYGNECENWEDGCENDCNDYLWREPTWQ